MAHLRRLVILGAGDADIVIAVVVVVRGDGVFGHHRLRVLISPWTIRLQESVNSGITWFVHVVSIVILKPDHQRRCGAFNIYFRSGKTEDLSKLRYCIPLVPYF